MFVKLPSSGAYVNTSEITFADRTHICFACGATLECKGDEDFKVLVEALERAEHRSSVLLARRAV